MQPSPRPFDGRSTFVDALRGIAALSVACYHINRYGPLPELAESVVPDFLAAWFDRGWMGVQVFFVISGFVIAYSVRNARITPGYVGNYALRRSIRLDPPYWATILVVFLDHWIFNLHLGFTSIMDFPDPREEALSWGRLLSHLVYMQNILGYENLSAGFWTLCIEVQFYLMYVVGLGFAQRLPDANRRTPADAGPIGLLGLFGPLAVLSLFLWNHGGPAEGWAEFFGSLGWHWIAQADPGRPYWITHFFCMFFLGCLAWWTLDGRTSAWAFWGYVGLMLVRLGMDTWDAAADALAAGQPTDEVFRDAALTTMDLKMALAAGIALYLLGRRGKLGTTLDFGPLQYLGRISYSLYLIHFPIAHVVTTLGYEHMNINGSLSPWGAAAWLLVALVASIGVAHLLYRFVEAPSVRLAARLKPGPGRGGPERGTEVRGTDGQTEVQRSGGTESQRNGDVPKTPATTPAAGLISTPPRGPATSPPDSATATPPPGSTSSPPLSKGG